MVTTNKEVIDCLVATLKHPQDLNIYSLVLSAADITHRIQYISTDTIEIYVCSKTQEKAQSEITAYFRENPTIPEIASDKEAFQPTFKALSPLLMGGLVIFYLITGDWNQQSIFFTRGCGDSTAILEHLEFYRLITPLTLHADLVHLLGNCLLGTFLLHFFFHLTGNGIGLAILLTTSALANFLNVFLRGPGHLFVGFSTTIFCVIGILSTMNFISPRRKYSIRFFMPVMAGLALLVMLGSSGERTDLGAHLFGLLTGLLGGNFIRLRLFLHIRGSFFNQTLLGISTFIIIVGCWQFVFM